MSLLRVKANFRAKANKISDRFRMNAKTFYDDEYMKLETHYNVAMDSIKGTAPYIVATGLGKVSRSFNQTQFRTPSTTKTTSRGADRGRIDKQKRFTFPDMGKAEEEARAKYEERQHLKRIAQLQEAKMRVAEARAIAKEEAAYPTFHRQCSAPPEPVPEPTYLSTLPNHGPIYDHTARQKFIHEKLQVILGEQRMNMGVGLPSGHSGIDPAIAEYHQQKATAYLLENIDAWKSEQRHQAEEQQWQFAQEEEERKRIQAIVDFARGRYMQQVEKLALYGPQMREGIDMLEAAVQNNNLIDMAEIVRVMTIEILEPAHALFKAMNENIPLEEEGARVLKEQWPVERLDKLYTFLKNESSLPEELIYFAKGIEAICKPVIHPTPFENPLDPKPVPVSGSYPTNTGGATSVDIFANLAKIVPGGGLPASAPLAPAKDAILTQPNNGPDFESFADFANASKATQSSQQAPSITVTTPACQEKQDLMLHMQNTLFELQMTVQDLYKGDNLPNMARKDATDALKQCVDIANGKKKLLNADEGVLFKAEVKYIQSRIANLPHSAKKPIKTRELDVLANSTLKLWV